MSDTIKRSPAIYDFGKIKQVSSTDLAPSPETQLSPKIVTNVPSKPTINRCTVCSKKLGLLPFNCKCGTVTCAKHRWPDHQCGFDFKKRGVEIIKNRNPQLIAEKLQQI